MGFPGKSIALMLMAFILGAAGAWGVSQWDEVLQQQESPASPATPAEAEPSGMIDQTPTYHAMPIRQASL